MTKKIFKGVILSCLISSCGVGDKQNNEKLNTNGKTHGPQAEVSIDSSSIVTLIANVTNGKNILKKTDSSIPGYKINDFYKSIFDKTKFEFIKVCGDEIIESQKLSAFLVITARMDFKNKASKDAFESTIGANKNIFE